MEQFESITSSYFEGERLNCESKKPYATVNAELLIRYGGPFAQAVYDLSQEHSLLLMAHEFNTKSTPEYWWLLFKQAQRFKPQWTVVRVDSNEPFESVYETVSQLKTKAPNPIAIEWEYSPRTQGYFEDLAKKTESPLYLRLTESLPKKFELPLKHCHFVEYERYRKKDYQDLLNKFDEAGLSPVIFEIPDAEEKEVNLEVYSVLAAKLNGLGTRNLMQGFANELKAQRVWEPREAWGQFPFYLAQRSEREVPKYLKDWAFVEWALFSALFYAESQSDLKTSLSEGQVALNPGAQIRKVGFDFKPWFEAWESGEIPEENPPEGERILIISRADTTHKILWTEADIMDCAILDLLEEGLQNKELLLQELAHKKILGKNHIAEGAWEEKITEMYEKNIIVY